MNFASSDIRSGVQAGVERELDLDLFDARRAATALWMSSWIIGPAGHPIDVSEWMIFTFSPSISAL